MKWKTFPVRVADTQTFGDATRHLVFERDDGQALEFQAGQFVNVHFEHEGEPIHRSYSVANAPGSERFEIALGRVEGGRASELLFKLEPGETIDVSGPYGRFVLRDDEPCRYLLVATGTGVTPYRSMLPELAERLRANASWAVDLVLGVRTKEDLLYGEEFEAFAEAHRNFRFHPCYSRETDRALREGERSGYVQHHLDSLDPDPEHDIAYLCGNPGMVDSALEALKERGFPLPRIRREKYVSARS